VPDVDRIWFGTYFYGFGGVEYPIISLRKPLRGNVSTRTTDVPESRIHAVDGDQVWVGSEKGLSLLDKKTEGWKKFYSTK